jgi:hypothetical protein
MPNLKKTGTFLAVSVLVTALTMTGCTQDEQRLAAAGAIAGTAALAISQSRPKHNNYYYHNNQYYTGGTYRNGYYHHGDNRYSGGHYYNNDGYRYHNGNRYEARRGYYGY